MDLLWPTMYDHFTFQGKTWKWASESGNVVGCWRPSLAQGTCLTFCATTHPYPGIAHMSFKMNLFTGWVTSSDLSILTHSLGTRTPMESTQPAPLRYQSLGKRQFRQTLNAGLDGRLQEVVLHAPPRPPQLWHWLRNQQAQVQTGQITDMISLEYI